MTAMLTAPVAATTAGPVDAPAGPSPCYRYPGFAVGTYVHPEPEGCRCFAGGPGPVKAITEFDLLLAAAADRAAAAARRSRRWHVRAVRWARRVSRHP